MLRSSSNSPSREHEQGRITTHTLVGVGGWLDGQRFNIVGNTVLGRDPGCGLIIPGNYLSRQHAELKPVGVSLEVKDLGSSNGTFIKEQRIEQTTLHHGDEIRFDTLRFRLEIGNSHTYQPSISGISDQRPPADKMSHTPILPPTPSPASTRLYAPPEAPVKPGIVIGPWIAMALASLLLAAVMVLFL